MQSNQLVAARGLLRWTQSHLAEASGVSLATIRRLEGMAGEIKANSSTVQALQAALEAAGVIFIAENGEGPGVRLRKERPE